MKKRMITLLLALALLLTMSGPVFAEGTVYSTQESFVAAVRDHMIARETEFVLDYAMPGNITQAELDERANVFIESALVHDLAVPKGGDYLRWHISGGAGFGLESYVPDGDTLIFSFRFAAPYYTTAAQEAQLDEWVNQFVADNGLRDPRKSDYDKVRIIYNWMCDNVTYDKNGGDLIKQSAYAAAILGTAVCQGYASLFYRLALESGVEARLVTGQSYNPQNVLEGHAWNIVYLAGRSYLLDATWDAGTTQSGNRFFLKGITAFDVDHFLNTTQQAGSLQPAYSYTALNVSTDDLHRNRGDVNGDGDVNLLDAACLYTYLATGGNEGILTEEAFLLAADVNYSGTVDVLDYQYLCKASQPAA